MAKLNAASRNSLSLSQFGLPKQRKYPMPDKSHAVNAKARAAQMNKRGLLSLGSMHQIKAKANRVLAK